MNIKPREQFEALETVIMFNNLAPTYLTQLPIRFEVTQYIYIHGPSAKPLP